MGQHKFRSILLPPRLTNASRKGRVQGTSAAAVHQPLRGAAPSPGPGRALARCDEATHINSRTHASRSQPYPFRRLVHGVGTHARLNVSSPLSRATRTVCVFATLMWAPIVARAQDPAPLTGDIRGTVRDSTNAEPVFGAQVFVLGSTRGTITDSAGRYALRVPAGAVTIRVQRLGYAPLTRDVDATGGNVTVVDFLAHAVVVTLSEIQVIGYGTEDRSQVTGALSTLQGSEIAGQPEAGVDAALQGHVPGVQITQNSGDPGNGISIRIRGASSINASNQPLFVIDGLPIATDQIEQIWSGGNAPTPLSALDVNEIESITILKDASSAAIYGSRAANGVVLITTKRGHAGKAQFTMDASTGWQNAEKRLDMLKTKDYVTLMNEASTNDGDAPLYSASLAAGPSTDWQSQVFRTAPVSNVHLGLSGGSGPLRYSVDGSYFAQTGVELSSSYDRANVRLNADYDVNPKFAIKSSLALSHEVDDRVKSDFHQHGLLLNAISTPPIYPVRDAQGQYFGGDDQIDGSPLPSTNAASIAAYDRFPSRTDHVFGKSRSELFRHAENRTDRASGITSGASRRELVAVATGLEYLRPSGRRCRDERSH